MTKYKKLLIALSFDDGYLTHVTIARFLAKLGIKATFYCITHLKTFEGKPLLTIHPEHIQEISDLGHEIGSHTCTHPDLTKISKERLEYELKKSRLFLEDITGKEVMGLAYPYGHFNTLVLSVTSKNYYYARSAGLYKIEDVYNIRRWSRYTLAAMTTNRYMKARYLPLMPIKVVKGDTLYPIMLLHDACIVKVFTLISALKMLNAHFITVKELATYLEK